MAHCALDPSFRRTPKWLDLFVLYRNFRNWWIWFDCPVGSANTHIGWCHYDAVERYTVVVPLAWFPNWGSKSTNQLLILLFIAQLKPKDPFFIWNSSAKNMFQHILCHLLVETYQILIVYLKFWRLLIYLNCNQINISN